MAVDADAPLRIAAKAIVDRRSRMPLRVMHNPQVEKSVVVVVKPSRGNGPLAVVDAGLGGHVFEPPVTQVVIEDIAIHACDEQVCVTVVVVIASRGAHGITFTGDA